jgi:cell division protein FtsI/penicillin-binding protein 2
MDAKHMLNWFFTLVLALTVIALRVWIRQQPEYQTWKERRKTKEAESLKDYLVLILLLFF